MISGTLAPFRAFRLFLAGLACMAARVSTDLLYSERGKSSSRSLYHASFTVAIENFLTASLLATCCSLQGSCGASWAARMTLQSQPHPEQQTSCCDSWQRFLTCESPDRASKDSDCGFLKSDPVKASCFSAVVA